MLVVAEERKHSRQHIWRFFRAGGFDQVRIDSRGWYGAPVVLILIVAALWHFGFIARWVKLL